jgi:TonB family protein
MLNTSLDRRAPSRRALITAAVLLVAAALPAAALRAAQIGPRSLTGTIYDASGGVLPGVPLTLEDAQEFKWQAVTDASGRFEFPPVQPGRYALEATLPGFRALRGEFELETAGDWDRAIILQVGELTERVTVSASRIPAGSAQAVQPSGPARVRVGGNIRAPHKLYNVNPIFPATMREAGRSGVVPVEAIVGPDGSVHSARVRGGHIHPDFAAAALDAVRQWRYSPTLLNGVPVEVVMTVTVAFSLEE